MIERIGRVGRAFVAVVAAAWCVLGATTLPAGAHNVGGGKYVSQVTGITPPNPAVSASIGGGDELFALTVQPGHEVVVLGYDAEPYLRIAPDGTVYENHVSPARYYNQDRYATTTPPPEANAAAATAHPDWQVIGTGGSWVWHDHRIHWMSPKAPPAIKGKESQTVQLLEWHVPMTVDGTAVAVDGLLRYTPTKGSSAWVETGITVGIPLVVIAALGWWSVRSAKRRTARVAENA